MGIATGSETIIEETNELIHKNTLVGMDISKRSLSFKEEFIVGGEVNRPLG